MDDRTIILMLRQRPAEGLDAAIQQYGRLLEVVIGRILRGCPQDVEECVADTFVAAWKTIDRLEPDGSLKGYLLCIARNNAINRYHQLARQDHVSIEDMDLADRDDVALEVIGEETMLEVQNSIRELEEPDREIMIRKYFLFEPVKSIAERLGLDVIQVKNRLYRTRQRLRRTLAERGVYDEAI